MRQVAREQGNRNPFLVPRARRFLVTWLVTKMPSDGVRDENAKIPDQLSRALVASQ